MPAIFRWTWPGRALVFVLAASSIWCLLAEFYGLCSMRAFTFAVVLPSSAGLAVLAVLDGYRGDGRLCRAVIVGGIAGLAAAGAYDLFRLPFVFAHEWGLEEIVPVLPLFKVFPRFGAMILGEPATQATYSAAAHLIGWVYHFSNGLTFGVMYLALIGDGRRNWAWAIVLAMGLELAMLLTPYPKFFNIPLTRAFIAITFAAHLVFGLALGLGVRGSHRWLSGPARRG